MALDQALLTCAGHLPNNDATIRVPIFEKNVRFRSVPELLQDGDYGIPYCLLAGPHKPAYVRKPLACVASVLAES